MAHQLSAAQAKSRLADCLRKAERGESVIITRRGRPVAALVAVDQAALPKPKGTRASHPAPARCTLAELVRLLRRVPEPDRGYAETLATIIRRQPNLPRSSWQR
jgi:prevent-host-death family protein